MINKQVKKKKSKQIKTIKDIVRRYIQTKGFI